MRGADLVVERLLAHAVDTVFALSGNHVMTVFDAALGRLRLVHVRQEAAAVHAAEAWARCTGRVGVALVTGGQGHANAAAALYAARCAETPLVLLSGHAPTTERGRGAFQEFDQAALAAPVAKASWLVPDAASLGPMLDAAFATAAAARPGPVALSLPSDLLAGASAAYVTAPVDPPPTSVSPAAQRLLDAAARPLLLAGPAFGTPGGRAALAACGAPALVMESPRGLDDPSPGRLRQALAEADLVVLLAKRLDFTLGFGVVAPQAAWVVLDPEPEARAMAAAALGSRLQLAEAACDLPRLPSRPDWEARVAALLGERAPTVATADGLHPATVVAAVRAVMDELADPVLAIDGGEFGQWAQAGLPVSRRLINGVAGGIGASLPMALGARAAHPGATVFALLGDGSAGFHLAEFETARRCALPFVAVIGNDSLWNAEHQIQRRLFGAERAHGCALSPRARYDEVVRALGGWGALVTEEGELLPALRAAAASGLPACVNVRISPVAAPVLGRAA